MNITLTEAASTALKNLINSSKYDNDKAYVLFSVKSGGCSGFTYQFGLSQEALDGQPVETTTAGGVQLVVPKKALPLLDGTVIDYDDSVLPPAFSFANPNAASSCGCSNSFSTSDKGC